MRHGKVLLEEEGLVGWMAKEITCINYVSWR
jgi:hypothetical protein